MDNDDDAVVASADAPFLDPVLFQILFARNSYRQAIAAREKLCATTMMLTPFQPQHLYATLRMLWEVHALVWFDEKEAWACGAFATFTRTLVNPHLDETRFDSRLFKAVGVTMYAVPWTEYCFGMRRHAAVPGPRVILGVRRRAMAPDELAAATEAERADDAADLGVGFYLDDPAPLPPGSAVLAAGGGHTFCLPVDSFKCAADTCISLTRTPSPRLAGRISLVVVEVDKDSADTFRMILGLTHNTVAGSAQAPAPQPSWRTALKTHHVAFPPLDVDPAVVAAWDFVKDAKGAKEAKEAKATTAAVITATDGAVEAEAGRAFTAVPAESYVPVYPHDTEVYF